MSRDTMYGQCARCGGSLTAGHRCSPLYSEQPTTQPKSPPAQPSDRDRIERIIAGYKEHYDFPWQGESHMRDCLAMEFEYFQPQGEPPRSVADGWISVEDRLPDFHGNVLTWDGEEMVTDNLNHCTPPSFCMDDHTKVTHWQPLPPPPEEPK